MKRNPKGYTIRKRNDCNRWELIVRGGKGWPTLYGGLYLTEKEALKAFGKNWLGKKME